MFTGVAKIYDPATTVFNGTTYTRDGVSERRDQYAARSGGGGAAVAASGADHRAGGEQLHAHCERHRSSRTSSMCGWMARWARAIARLGATRITTRWQQPVTPLPDGSGLISGSVLGSFNYAGLSNVLGQQAVFNETHTFTPHLLNDLRLGYTRRGNTTDGVTLGEPASQATGDSGNSDERGVQQCAAAVYVYGHISSLESSPSTYSQYQTGVWQLVDTVNWVHGAHAVKAGVDARWYQLNTVSPPNPTGSFAFTTTGTNLPSVTEQRQLVCELPAGPGGYVPDRSATAEVTSAGPYRGVLCAGRLEGDRRI